jgi:hypothetical protein
VDAVSRAAFFKGIPRSDLDLSGARTSARRARRPRTQPGVRRAAYCRRYRGNPRVQAHGPGWKILLGDDQVDRWENYLD